MIGGLRIGELDRLFEFETRTTTTSVTGSVAYNWVRGFSRFGKFMAKAGGEKSENDQPIHDETARIMFRAGNEYKPTQRIKDIRYNEYWYVTGISRNQREYVVIEVSRKDNQAA